jgi:glycosyltransferase involved in cell wall biosynthesis
MFMMKMLFISPRFSGGIGGHAAMLADKLTEYGYEVKKMEVPHVPIKNLKNPSFALFSTIKGIASREKFDIVHAFNIPSGYAMKYVKGAKKVLSVHGVFSDQVSSLHSNSVSSLAKIAELQVLKWPDKLTTDSKATQKMYKEKLELGFEYLPSPIDVTKFTDLPHVEKVPKQVAYLGRESFEKGIDVLKKAESQIKGKVVYCYDRPWKEAMTIMKSSCVVVVPSRMESLPTTIKEAFFLKIPVVATNVGGIPELVKNNETGLLVPANNPQKLAESVNKLLENKQNANQLAKSGYEFIIKNMTWDVILPKYIEFYENLLRN